ncbi:hypothetical protein [Bradyrhizobium sp. BR 10289]|uniref:hypothetical protein n=1 Tax=Bradyrhizobium sp. BR 10289 TaxID=2749993 RepID=UPI001C64F1C0|nr:hypothetical protein [Bradyrhizobium sp. BR 10289]MBW7968363.1 hypothetical protein [Bradyrhizobium sp. BR 10289]
MRIFHFIFAGALTIGTMAAPAVARDTQPQKGEDQAISSSCSAYQQAADGSWQRLPCKETSEPAQPQPRNKRMTQGAERITR